MKMHLEIATAGPWHGTVVCWKRIYRTYQFTRQLPTVRISEGDHVVSYYTSQSLYHFTSHLRKCAALRTFVQESHCALQFPHCVCARPRPRHVQIVEHVDYG